MCPSDYECAKTEAEPASITSSFIKKFEDGQVPPPSKKNNINVTLHMSQRMGSKIIALLSGHFAKLRILLALYDLFTATNIHLTTIISNK